MTCKGDTYKRWGFDGCERKAMVKRNDKLQLELARQRQEAWDNAEPLFSGVEELAHVRKAADGTLVMEPSRCRR